MKKRMLLYCVALTATVSYTYAQQLYMPRNIRKAYEKGTRRADGKPGPKYWQNRGIYDIHEEVRLEKKAVSGKEITTASVYGEETIIYYNNSPDTLDHIMINFVNNLHKPEAMRNREFKPGFLDSGLTITKLVIDKKSYNQEKEESKSWGTTGAVWLQVLPGKSITLEIGWNYPLSRVGGREGQVNPGTFYCAYSYPRVSVYDDYNDWDELHHLGTQEFYNDFNNYTYSVTAPKNYVVWGTGKLLNYREVLQPKIAERLEKSYQSDDVIHVANADEMKKGEVTVQNFEFNTWKFKADTITDICYAVSNSYVWDASSVVVDPTKPNQRVSMQAAFDDDEDDFHDHVSWGVQALKFLSTQWPGIPYPYPTLISFLGTENMEYPMIANDTKGSTRSGYNHEIAHTYFPFYMGTHETRYAFMDEAWAQTFEYLIRQNLVGEKEAERAFIENITSYANNYFTEADMPIITMTSQLNRTAYGLNAYDKPSLSYLALKDLLGDSLFKKALHYFIAQWHGKHPTPWDYFNCMNAGSDQNLNWFFNNWFFTNNYIDLKIDNVIKEQGGYKVGIQNIGGFAIAFDVKVTYEDNNTSAIHITPAIWKSNGKEQSVVIAAEIINGRKVKSIQLDGRIFKDSAPQDNVWNGPF